MFRDKHHKPASDVLMCTEFSFCAQEFPRMEISEPTRLPGTNACCADIVTRKPIVRRTEADDQARALVFVERPAFFLRQRHQSADLEC